MVKKEDGGPAFSVVEEDTTTQEKNLVIQFPVSLRDYFAGQALAGLLGDQDRHYTIDAYVSGAYKMADAMLAERAK